MTSPIVPNGERPTRTGTRWEVQPGDDAFGIEVQHTTDGGVSGAGTAATSAWTRVVDLPAGRTVFGNFQPLTTQRHYYRIRHVREGFIDGPFSTDVCALPAPFGGQDEPEDPRLVEGTRRLETLYQTDKVLQAGVGVVDTGTILVTDSTGGASSITKTLRIPHTEAVPANDAVFSSFTATFLANRVGGEDTQFDYFMPVVLPQGVTVTQISARLLRGTTGSVATFELFLVENDDSSSIASLVATTGSTDWVSIASSSMATVVGTTQAFTGRVRLFAQTAVANAKFQFAEVEYSMPSYDKGY